MRNRTAAVLCACVCWLISGSAVLNAATDTILLTNGETVNGRVTSDRPETIMLIDEMGTQRPIQANQIRAVYRYLPNKTDWNRAMEQLEYEQIGRASCRERV